MFTKKDYQQYFEEIAMSERAMVYQVQDIIAEVEAKNIKLPLQTIVSDEVRHYRAMMKLLDRILLKDESEKRAFYRKHALGWVTLRDTATGQRHEGYCVNLSSGGICVELADVLPAEAVYVVDIELFEGNIKTQETGTMRWVSEIQPAYYMAGIRCRGGLEFVSDQAA